MQLAKQFGIRGFASPAGGCLLTCQESAAKIRDVLENNENASLKDMKIVRIGRHFRFGNSRIIVGRNFEDNQKLMKLKSPEDYFFEAEEKIPSPITLLQGDKSEKAIETAAKLTGYYSDGSGKKITIRFGKEKLENSIKPETINETEVNALRITWKKPINTKKYRH
jgi:hypothetical protein